MSTSPSAPASPDIRDGDGARASRLLTVAVLSVSSLTVLANATIAPSLPGLARAFSTTPGIETLAGLVLSLPSLAIVLTAVLVGLAADRFDRRAVLVGAMIAYALGGASGAFAQTLPQLLLGRLLLGVGVAGTLTVATKLAADHWHGADRARFMGWQGAAISATGVASVVLGGLLAELSWRAPFLIYLAALPLAILAWVAIPSRKRSARARNQAGGPAEPSNDAARQDQPFPWATLALTGGIMSGVMVFIFLVATRLPFLLGEIGVRSPGLIGLTLGLMTAASFPTGLFYGRVRTRFEPRAIAVLALALMGTGFAVISQAHALPAAVIGIIATGLGLGLIIPNQNVWLMAHAREAARGRAAGMMTMLLFAGQFVSPLVSGGLLTAMSLHAVFLAFALAAFAGAGLLWGTGRHRPDRERLAA